MEKEIFIKQFPLFYRRGFAVIIENKKDPAR
jgi:hypothetical protein